MNKNFYKETREKYKNNLSQLWTYKYFVKKVGFKKGEVVLDIGCADGVLGIVLNNVYLMGCDLVKSDFDLRKNGYKKFFVCDIERSLKSNENFNLSKNMVDTVVLSSVFQYLEFPEEAFKNLLRISKKRIIIFGSNMQRLFLNGKIENNYSTIKAMKYFASKYNLKLRLIYVSNRFNLLRKIYPKYLAGGIIAVFEK